MFLFFVFSNTFLSYLRFPVPEVWFNKKEMGWSRLHYKCIAIIQKLVQNLKEKCIHTSAYFSRLFLSFLFTYRSVRVQTVSAPRDEVRGGCLGQRQLFV